MYGTTSDSMFGDDGTFAGDYGAPPPMPAPGVPQVPGTVISAEAALPPGVKAQPGTVIVSQTPLPPGVRAQPGTVVVATNVGRGGRSINGGLPPLPAGVPPGIDPTLWMTGLGTNMPLPGRPVGSTPYPYDMQRFRGGTVGGYFAPMKPGTDYWSGTAADSPTPATSRDVKSVNFASDGYTYRIYTWGPKYPDGMTQYIDVIKNGKVVVESMSAESSPAAYKAIMDEVQGKQRANTALILTAINAAALIGAAAISAGRKPRRKKAKKPTFDASGMATPPADAGIPMWVWFAGGGVVLAGIGLIVMSGRQPAPEKAKGAT